MIADGFETAFLPLCSSLLYIALYKAVLAKAETLLCSTSFILEEEPTD